MSNIPIALTMSTAASSGSEISIDAVEANMAGLQCGAPGGGENAAAAPIERARYHLRMNAADSLTPVDPGYPLAVDTDRDQRPILPDLLALGRHPLTAVVQGQLRDRCGVDPGASILVGVSGGADSVALLLAVAALRDRLVDDCPVIQPTAMHVHHHLRESADHDACFVAALCDSLNIPCRIAHVNPGALRGNVAANARRLRYQQLASAAGTMGAAFVAVAHHADDQLETMLMALCRGGGISRLRGLRWRRALGPSSSADSCNKLWLVRPLLESTHAECEGLCRAAGVRWREDPTNRSASTARGRLRQDVIPVLRSIWPRCAEHSTIAAGQITWAHDVIERELDSVFGPARRRSWPRADLRPLPADLIVAGLRRALSTMDDLPAAQRTPRITRSLASAARMIASADSRRKQFTLGGSCCLLVTAHEVSITVIADTDRASMEGLAAP